MNERNDSGIVGLFPQLDALRPNEVVTIEGHGHLALKIFGSTVEVKGVSIYARRERDDQPLQGAVTYEVHITEDFELVWSESGSLYHCDELLRPFVAPHGTDAVKNMRNTDPIAYMFLVKDAFWKELSSLRRDQDWCVRAAAATSHDPAFAAKAKEKLTLFNERFGGRMKSLELVWRAIVDWGAGTDSLRDVSIGDLIDQMLADVKSSLSAETDASTQTSSVFRVTEWQIEHPQLMIISDAGASVRFSTTGGNLAVAIAGPNDQVMVQDMVSVDPYFAASAGSKLVVTEAIQPNRVILSCNGEVFEVIAAGDGILVNGYGAQGDAILELWATYVELGCAGAAVTP